MSTVASKAIIMAAGKGTRMGGDLPKVLHKVCGKPMVWWVVQACKEAGVDKCVIVVGYKAELVKEALAGETCCEFVIQAEQLGTGHAAQMAAPVLKNLDTANTFVLAGDGPLIQSTTLKKLLEVHTKTNAKATLATAVIDNPTGYGRVIREADGSFGFIIEQKDASEEQLKTKEVNPSYYCFNNKSLFESLANVKNDNSQGEYYITDVPGLLKEQGQIVSVVDAVPAEDILSVNTTEQLADVEAILAERIK